MEPPADPELRRFVVELEFVQCLANFGYLHFLAQRRYLEDESFVAYLRYLRYWESPPCVRARSRRARRARALSLPLDTASPRARVCARRVRECRTRARVSLDALSSPGARAATPGS